MKARPKKAARRLLYSVVPSLLGSENRSTAAAQRHGIEADDSESLGCSFDSNVVHFRKRLKALRRAISIFGLVLLVASLVVKDALCDHLKGKVGSLEATRNAYIIKWKADQIQESLFDLAQQVDQLRSNSDSASQSRCGRCSLFQVAVSIVSSASGESPRYL